MLLFKGKKDLRVLNILKNSLSFLKNWKVFLVAVFFVLYTVVILGFGYILQRNDYYGLVLKPALLQNYRMVVNYFNSFSVDPEKLILDIKHRHYMKLAYKRQEALEAGTLPKSPDDWVPATLSHRGKKVEIDIRLKGNGIEHWKHKNYWSFKVKVKGNKTLFGMKRLALQQPKVRTFMNEWYWHKLLKYSGLIYMRYNFVDLTVNGKHYSIYAIEENYGKRLIENNHLKEGPIFWAGLSPVGTLKATSAYQSKQYKRDILQAAESRLEAYRQGDLQLSKVFDVEEWARLVAIADLVGSRHSLTIGNIKLYYNPVTGLISPIGNDSSIPLSRQKEFNFLGEEQRFVEGSEDANSLTYWKWPLGLFQDKTFFKKYIESLEEISDKIFLDRFFLEISKEEREAIKILH